MNVDVGKLYDQALKIAKSLLTKWGAVIESDELSSLVNLSIAEALSRFDPSKGASIITFLYYHLKGNVIKIIEERKSCLEFSGDETFMNYSFNNHGDSSLIDRTNPEDLCEQKQLNDRFYNALDQLSDLEKQLLILNLEHGYKVQHIAKKLGLSRSYLSKIKHAALRKVCMQIGLNEDLKDLLHSLQTSKYSVSERRKAKIKRTQKTQKFKGARKVIVK